MKTTYSKEAIKGFAVGLALAVITGLSAGCSAGKPGVRLFAWDRGIALESREQPGMKIWLWLYEWHMFDAVSKGQHTPGQVDQFVRKVSPDENQATLTCDYMRLDVKAVQDGAELLLTVANRSEHDWPELAGVIPCFNPGPPDDLNSQFCNEKTYFVGPTGLARQEAREIHFNAAFRPAIDAQSDNGKFAWSDKWPTSQINAAEGLMLRESNDGQWVTGIAWERFLSAQGHNPWRCMHLCVRVGPLKQGETRTVRGKIYLFRGNRAECYRRYNAEFGPSKRN